MNYNSAQRLTLKDQKANTVRTVVFDTIEPGVRYQIEEQAKLSGVPMRVLYDGSIKWSDVYNDWVATWVEYR